MGKYWDIRPGVLVFPCKYIVETICSKLVEMRKGQVSFFSMRVLLTATYCYYLLLWDIAHIASALRTNYLTMPILISRSNLSLHPWDKVLSLILLIQDINLFSFTE